MKFKRLFCVFLSIFLLASALSLTALAADSGKCGAGLNWRFSDGVLTITGSGAMTDYSDENMPPWYELRDRILRVVFPDGMTRVGNIAFFSCTSLRSVVLPANATEIGDYAFAECSSLASVMLSGKTVSIGEAAFSECSSLGAIQFPSTLNTIGDKAFYRCDSLRAVTVPSSVTFLGVQTFAYCKNLVRATVDAAVDLLPTWTFYGCENLNSVSLAATITRTGPGAFDKCEELVSVYTKSFDDSVALSIEESVTESLPGFVEEGGYVATYAQPDTTVYLEETEDEQIFSQTISTEDAVITVMDFRPLTGDSRTLDPTTGKPVEQGGSQSAAADQAKVKIEAAVFNEKGWEAVEAAVNRALAEQKTSSSTSRIDVVIQMSGTTVSAETLKSYFGKYVSLTLVTSTGIRWLMLTDQLSGYNLTGEYDLNVETATSQDEAEKKNVESAYRIRFAGDIDFPATVGIPLIGERSNSAGFFKDGDEEPFYSVRVDRDSLAWFAIGSVRKDEQFVIAINLLSTMEKDVVIPPTMYEDYEGTLMDAAGNRYTVGDRVSRWGITGGQFALYVGVAVGLIVLVIAVVMISRNHILKTRTMEKRRAEETKQAEKQDEEDLELKVLRELVDQKKEDQDKK